MAERRRVVELCTTDDPIQLEWISYELQRHPILADQTAEAYILSRAKACFDLDPDSVSEPDTPPPQAAELDPSHEAEPMSTDSDAQVPSPTADEQNESNIISQPEESLAADNQDDGDDVPLLRRMNSANERDNEPESAATSWTNSASPPPPSLAPPALSSEPQPTTISPSLLLAQPPSTSSSSAQAPISRISTLATDSHRSKSPSPGPSPSVATDSARPASSSTPVTISPTDYRPLISETLMSRSSQSVANKLIALLAPSSGQRPVVPAPQRVEILSAMRSGSKTYLNAWLTNPNGMDLLGSWLKSLVAKESEQWRSTAVVLLEVVGKLDFSKEFIEDKNKSGSMTKYLRAIRKSDAVSTKVQGLAVALIESMLKIAGAPSTNGKSSALSADDESNKKRKLDTAPTSSKPASSSTSKPLASSTAGSKPVAPGAKPVPRQSLAKLIPASKAAAAKADSSWFSKPAPTSAPKKVAAKPANVFQQAVAASTVASSSSLPVKRPIAAVEEPAKPEPVKVETSAKPGRRIKWRDHERPGTEVFDVRYFAKQAWELQFDMHHQSVAQLDQDEGSSMMSHKRDIEDDLIDWTDPSPLLFTEDEASDAFPAYVGTHVAAQAALDALDIAVTYDTLSDIPPSPAETDKIIGDGPETHYYETPAIVVPPEKPQPVETSAVDQASGLDLTAILNQLNSNSQSFAGSSAENVARDEYNPFAAHAPPTVDYNHPPYQQTPQPPPQQHNGYNPYPPQPPPHQPYHAPPPQNGYYPPPPGPSQPMYGGPQPPYDPYGAGPSNGYDRDGQHGGVKRKEFEHNNGNNGYDRDGKRGRNEWDHGGGQNRNGNGNGHGGGGGWASGQQPVCKFHKTRNGCSKGNNCPFKH